MKNQDKIVLAGAGGHCKSVLDTLLKNKKYSEIVITDPDIVKGEVIMGCKVVGADIMLPDLHKQGWRFAAVTVGSIKSSRIRRMVAERLYNIGFICPGIVDPSAAVSEYVQLENGVFIGKFAVVNAYAAVRDFAIINTCSVVEHDCDVGEFAHIAVGAKVCGGCRIGRDTLVGANSTIIQGVKVGMNCIIGAGSIVLDDVPDNTFVTGVWG